jgi:hypothetical protein
MLKTAICLLLVVSSCSRAPAQDVVEAGKAVDARDGPGGTAVLELTTDMTMFASPPTSFLLGWQRNVNTLLRMGLDGVTGALDLRRSDKVLARLGVLAVFTGTSLIVNRAFSLTAHDISHMEAARAIGATSVSLVTVDTNQVMGIGEFFLAAFDFTSEAGLYSYVKNNLTWNEEARVAGEGLDTNLLIASAISTRINQGAGHVSDLAPYLLNKLWGVSYFLETGPMSDGSNYLDLLSLQGYGTVTRTELVVLNAAACMLSGGFLGLVKGTYDHIVEGVSTVTPLGLTTGDLSVQWPELTAWLNPDNVSLSVSVDGSWQRNVVVRAMVDSAVAGKTGVIPEVTLAAKVKIRRMSVGMELTSHFVMFPFVAASLEVDLNDGISIGLEGHYGEGGTMRELREHPLGPGASGFIRAAL